ncbi:universal stress protein Sll1388-like [Liolophura sinensis]|uniref:universal stress protein Sll1388-like n=1 Tax=Liolophura sinensis TaxID=3198878 RepID=UPI003158A0B6
MASANGESLDSDSEVVKRGVVLIAIDHSEMAEYAFDWYMDYGYRHDHSILLLHCPEVESLTRAPILLSGPEFLREALCEERMRVARLEEKYMLKMRERGLEGQFRTVEGRPGEAIVHVARTANAKLIVIGSRGSSKLRRTLLGSITDYVLNHAHVAVLVCRNKRHLLDHVLRKQASTEDGLRKRSLKDRLLRKYHSMDEPRAKDSIKKRERQSSQTDST